MLYPSIFNENLFDDLMDFDFPSFPDFNDARRASRVMKTDVHEHDDHYEVDIDLPGFKKNEIHLELENGYLTVSAAKDVDRKEKSKKGKVIRKERYSGVVQRSFYVGEGLTENDVRAKFEDGVLSLTIPKKEMPKLPEKRNIKIEG